TSLFAKTIYYHPRTSGRFPMLPFWQMEAGALSGFVGWAPPTDLWLWPKIGGRCPPYGNREIGRHQRTRGSEGPALAILDVHEPVELRRVFHLEVLAVPLEALARCSQGQDAQKDDLCHRAGVVEVRDGARTPFAGRDPLLVVPGGALHRFGHG